MAFDSYEMTPRGRRNSYQSRASSVTEVDQYSLNEYDSEKRDAQAAAAGNAAPGGDPPTEVVDAMELLPEHERSILKDQIDVPEKKFGAGALYAFATRLDIAIIIVSGFASAASGAALPCMTLIFGGLQGVFMEYLALQTITLDDFKQEMVTYVLYFIYLAIGTFVASYISNVGFIYTGEHIANNLRKAYLRSCLRQNIGYYDAVGVGEIVNRVTADALTVQEGISEKVGMLINAIFTFFTGFIIGFIKFWKLTLILCSTLVALFINTSIASKFLVKYSTPMIMSITEGAILGDEVFSSIRVALAFGIQDRMIKTYDNYLRDSHKWGLKTKITVAMMLAVTMSLTNLTYGLGFWQGSTFVAQRELVLQDLITTMMAVTVGAFQMGSIGPSFHAFTGSVSSASKMLNTIHRNTTINSASAEGTKLPDLKGNIRLENVKHIYPSRPECVVMNGVSLNIPAGKTTALVGASGSGKSTIVGLIERFYNPVGGRVLLDGHDVSTLNLNWLRQQIALVGQEPALFAVTILENIQYGLIGTPYEHASEQEQRERIVEAAKMANAHEFVSQLPDGYNTNVGDRGFLLSGGQKQRIAIARAIVSNPKILLLDEATSALDTKSEGVVQAALENASEGRTTITIAHRLSTVRQAHNIVVMNQGKIVEQGTHQELLAKKGMYFTLVSAQTIEDVNKAKVEAAMEPLDEEEEKLIRRMSKWKNVGGYLTDPSDVAQNHALRYSRVSRASMAGMGGRKSVKSMRSVKSLSEGAMQQKRGALTEEEPNYSFTTILKFIAGFNKREWYWMLLGLFCSVLCGGANPTQAVFFAKQVESLSTIDIPGTDRWAVQGRSNFWSLMYLMLGGVQFLANLGQGWALGICGEWLGRRVKLQTFSSLLRQDVSFYDQEKNNSGALTAFLCIETTAVIGMSGATLGTILVSITSVVSGITVSIAIGWELALVCSSVVPIVIACGYFRTKMLAHYNARTAHVYGESAAYAAENIGQMKTVAALTREDQVTQKYCDELDAQQKRSLKSVAKSSILFAASQSVMFLCFALGFYYGSTLIAERKYNQFQFYVCFNSIIFGAQSAGTFFSFAPDMAKAKNSSVNLKRLFERKPAIDTWEPEGRRLERVKGHIEFKNVHFRYPTRPEQPVLRGVNLKIRPGQYVAFVGASGCGKSTSIGLLERFYDPLVGQVLIDGNDVSKVNINDYRSHIALVSQEPTLYQGTIRENILMGCTDEESVSDAQIEKACRDANIQDFIMSLPEGMNTVVGAKGGLLSGGQKQRIAIARALVRQPKILLLDEATSALDSESEHIVQDALDQAAKGRTTITIAHRLSTVQHADAIFVFDAGRVVEAGTHSELMDINGRYAELVKLQSLNAA